MKYTVIIEPQAEADMRGIYRYVSIELCEPQTAANLLDRMSL